MNIVILDGYVVNPGDLDWSPIAALGNLTIYDRTRAEDIIHRSRDADVLITNKGILSAEVLSELPNLKCILLLATGYDNIDIDACRNRGIIVCNAVGYSSPSVAQHVFAYILHSTNHIEQQTTQVRNGGWSESVDWSYSVNDLIELNGKTLGIYGFGRIGQEVGKIASAFGMRILVNRRNPNPFEPYQVEYTNLETLFSQSDFITLHAPLSEANVGVVNHSLLKLMKQNAVLINTGRGGLINERHLLQALNNDQIKAAYLDVLSVEPPPQDHILNSHKKCFITPHQAWATKESRQRLIEIVASNLTNFRRGQPSNAV